MFHHKSACVRRQFTNIPAPTSRLFFGNNCQYAAAQFTFGPVGHSAGVMATGFTCVKFVRIRSYLLNNSISLELKLCCSSCGTTGPVSQRNCVMLHEGIIHAHGREQCASVEVRTVVSSKQSKTSHTHCFSDRNSNPTT